MAVNLKIIINGIDNVSGAFKSVGRGLDDLEGKAGKAKKALGPLNSLLGTGLKVAAGAAVGAIGALAVGLGASVLAAADMEQGVADIAAVMGLAADEVGPLKDLITDLGLDPKLKVTATEAADAIEMLAKNGLTMTDIVGGAARNTVLLANATGGDFGVAADIATDAMSLFNIQAGDMKRAVDGISGVTLSSKFDIEDYGLALAQAGGVAATVGVDFDDFNATIAAISPFFASGSDAGTSFKTFLQRLIPQSTAAEDAMRELGLITEDGKNKFYDASGQMKSMSEVSGLLNQAFIGLSEEQKNQKLATIFGTDAMRAAAGVAGMTEEEFLKLKATMAKTDAEQQAATRMNTLRGSLEILTGVFDTLKTGIGEKFLPVFKQLIDRATAYLNDAGPGLVNWAGDMATKLGALIDRYLPVFLAKVEEWIRNMPTLIEQVRSVAFQVGEFLIKVRDIIVPIASFILNITNLKGILIAVAAVMAVNALVSIVSFVAGVYSAVTAVGAFLVALSPVVLIVGGIALAIVGLYTAWQHNFLGIRDITQNVLDTLRGWFNDFPGTLQRWGQALGEKARWAMEQMRIGLDNARGMVRGAFDAVVDFLQAGRDQKLGPWAQSLYDAGSRAVTRLGEGFRAVQGAVSNQLQMVLNDAKERGWSYATGAFAGRMYDAARASMLRFVAGISESNLPGDLQRALERVGPAFDGWVSGFRNHVYGPMRDVANRIMDGIRDVDLAGLFSDKIYQIADTFNSFTAGFWTHVYQPMRDIGGHIVDGIADGLRDAWGRLQDALNWIASIAPQWIKDALGIRSPSKVFADIGKWIPPGIAEGIMQTSDQPLAALTDMFGQMTAMPATAGGGNMAGDISTVTNTTTNFNVSMPGNRGGSTSQQTKGLVDQLVAIYA